MVDFERLAMANQRADTRRASLSGDYPIEQAVAEALDDLRHRRASMFDLPALSFPEEQLADGDPDHPMARSNSHVRLEAAEYLYRLICLSFWVSAFVGRPTEGKLSEALDDFRSSVVGKVTILTRTLLDHLHEALFDRDAAVRLTVVETLAMLGRTESVPFLERLVECEDEGKLIPLAIQEALRGCRNGQARDIRLRSW
jgi:HEAT repeat protein